MSIFSVGDSLGALSQDKIFEYLNEIGDVEGAKDFRPGTVGGQSSTFARKSYSHTGNILGFISPINAPSGKSSAIVGIGEVDGDKALIGSRIKISLDKFYVHNYPGFGTHNILCEFTGKNQIARETEELRFALRFMCADKASASLSGVPIFIGVTVGNDGISFEGRTVNVGSTTDEIVLKALESPAFRNGLGLISAAQPALKPFSELAAAAVRTTLERKQNKQVHNFNLGLDFSSNATSAKLRQGSYVVVQKDASSGWSWSDFEWDHDAMIIQFKKDRSKEIDFNYMIFGVSEISSDVVAVV